MTETQAYWIIASLLLIASSIMYDKNIRLTLNLFCLSSIFIILSIITNFLMYLTND